MCNIIGEGSVNTLSTETYVVSQNQHQHTVGVSATMLGIS